MPVSTQIQPVVYQGNGATTVFAFNYLFEESSDLYCYIFDSTTMLITTLNNGTDYTVSGAGVGSGGTVTTTIAPTVTQKLAIVRSLPLTQNSSYDPNAAIPTQQLTTDLDRLVLIAQQLNNANAFSLSPFDTSEFAPLPAPAVRANTLLGFDGAGNPLVVAPPGSVLVNGTPFDQSQFAVASGTGFFSATLTPPVTAYVNGMVVSLYFPSGNGLSSPLLALNGLASIPILSSTNTTLLAGAIVSGGLYTFIYYNNAFYLINSSPFTNIASGQFIANLSGSPAAATPNSLIASNNALNMARVIVASTTSVVLGGASSTYVQITGTTTITSFDNVASGIVRNVLFGGSLTLTYNATSLILPGGGNIITQAGDVAVFVSEGSGNWRCLDYTTFSGQALTASSSTPSIPVRQTVLGGPVDTNGLPTFFPSTSGSLVLTTQNVSSSAPLVCTSANGFNSTGAVNNLGSSMSNLSWTASASATNYLYATLAGGVITPGSTTLAPVYQAGGTPSVANGQFTFLINSMTGYMGNGTTAPQANIVFVGECVAGASSITSTVAYAYQGLYDGAYTATLPSGGQTFFVAHNIGCVPRQKTYLIQCTTADAGYAVGDEITNPCNYNGTQVLTPTISASIKTAYVVLQSGGTTSAYIANRSTFVSGYATAANWKYKITCLRGW